MTKEEFNKDELNKEIDLSAIFKKVKSERILILSVLFISFFGSYLLGKIVVKDLYQSNALLKPLSQEQPATSDLLGQIGNVSALANAASFLDGPSEYKEIMEIALSKNFIKILINKDGFSENVIAAKDYNFNTKQIVYKSNVYGVSKSKWIRKKKKIKRHSPILRWGS